MHDDYYQNTLYPLQDKILEIVGNLAVGFYLTGWTALSRAYLNHRYSDDLVFFVNDVSDFKSQVNTVIRALADSGYTIDISVADDGFARIFVFDTNHSLKLDFVNDVAYRNGNPIVTPLFVRTDNLINILSNKVTALGRYSTKDIVDIVFMSERLQFNWEIIINDASKKDLWVNPINMAEVLERFPIEKLDEIYWTTEPPSHKYFHAQIGQIIADLLNGSDNSLYKE